MVGVRAGGVPGAVAAVKTTNREMFSFNNSPIVAGCEGATRFAFEQFDQFRCCGHIAVSHTALVDLRELIDVNTASPEIASTNKRQINV